MRKALISVALSVVLVLITLQILKNFSTRSTSDHGHAHAHATMGAMVPDFPLERLTGKFYDQREPTTLRKEQGKVTLINFWATWCEACLVEMPSILKLWEEFKPQGLSVIAVNVDDDLAGVGAEIEELKMKFGSFLDPERKMAEFFEIEALPFTAILDQNGKILAMETGDRNWSSQTSRKRFSSWLKDQGSTLSGSTSQQKSEKE